MLMRSVVFSTTQRSVRDGTESQTVTSYNELVGARLRSIRKQRGLSLQDVQRLSEGEFKAAVVGAYERGERSLSLPRRQDFNGKVLTIRRGDLRLLALLIDQSEEAFSERLSELGLTNDL
jgi:transcriptional regulator with XRE-family HTH domain